MTPSRKLALTLGILLGLAFATSCTEPTAPQPLVSCHPQVIQTPQGPWVTGQQVCDVTDPTTGQGHTEVRP
ncbi:hypothetical protein [Humibacter sp.]|uniref:hypothetical protein n=1 Tax=Humibacter sp. TaxID=1940291 RepID=UPI003F7E7257